MFEIETKKLEISNSLRRKVDMICRFASVKYELIPGEVKLLNNTNIAYAKPHILKVKDNDYLIFEESDIVFINGYKKKIRLCELQNYLRKKSSF